GAMVEARGGMGEQVLVADQAGLARAAEAVAAEPRAALDTESNGFHAYSEQVCLVQIATPRADFAVDVLAVGLGPLLPLLADPAREVVLHAAEYDVQHLLALRERMGVRLSERGLLSEAEAEFARLTAKEPRPRQFDAEGWQKMKAARTLDGRGRGVLREMYLLRDRRAREVNRPPFK